jgi:hypothetical protein
MIVNDAEERNGDEQHEPGFPCPVCHVITLRQPWASLIALGFKHVEFRSRYAHYRGPVVIHAGSHWYTPALRELVRFHFRKYTLKPDEAISALFPLSRPVADAAVDDCKQWTDDSFAISLAQVRIVTRPKPAFNGMIPVPWKTEQTKELASALGRARVLEGREKDALYQEFELLALRSKINVWLKSKRLGQFALTSPR